MLVWYIYVLLKSQMMNLHIYRHKTQNPIMYQRDEIMLKEEVDNEVHNVCSYTCFFDIYILSDITQEIKAE
jgi:hypothetical protein